MALTSTYNSTALNTLPLNGSAVPRMVTSVVEAIVDPIPFVSSLITDAVLFINNGNAQTEIANVALTLGAANAVFVKIEGDVLDSTNTFVFLPMASSIRVVLTPGAGTKQVRAVYRDINKSELAVSASIVLSSVETENQLLIRSPWLQPRAIQFETSFMNQARSKIIDASNEELFFLHGIPTEVQLSTGLILDSLTLSVDVDRAIFAFTVAEATASDQYSVVVQYAKSLCDAEDLSSGTTRMLLSEQPAEGSYVVIYDPSDAPVQNIEVQYGLNFDPDTNILTFAPLTAEGVHKFYYRTLPYNQQQTATFYGSTHTVQLIGLEDYAHYFYRFLLRDRAGNLTVAVTVNDRLTAVDYQDSDSYSETYFRTYRDSVSPQLTAESLEQFVSGEAFSVTETSATFSWCTDEPTTAQVIFGTGETWTTLYMSQKFHMTQELEMGELISVVTDETTIAESLGAPVEYTTTTKLSYCHSLSLTKLLNGVTYNVRLVLKDRAGNMTVSDPYPFTTLTNRTFVYETRLVEEDINSPGRYIIRVPLRDEHNKINLVTSVMPTSVRLMDPAYGPAVEEKAYMATQRNLSPYIYKSGTEVFPASTTECVEVDGKQVDNEDSPIEIIGRAASGIYARVQVNDVEWYGTVEDPIIVEPDIEIVGGRRKICDKTVYCNEKRIPLSERPVNGSQVRMFEVVSYNRVKMQGELIVSLAGQNIDADSIVVSNVKTGKVYEAQIDYEVVDALLGLIRRLASGSIAEEQVVNVAYRRLVGAVAISSVSDQEATTGYTYRSGDFVFSTRMLVLEAKNYPQE